MKFTITFLLITLLAIQINAKKRSEENEDEETEMNKDVQQKKPAKPFGFTFGNPFGLALQIPIINPEVFGNLQRQMRRLRQTVFMGGASPTKEGQIMDADGKKVKVKTRTKTSNSTHGPFKTYTITKETVSADNKKNPKVLSKSVQSVTTLDKEFKGKMPKGEKDKLKKMLFNFGPMQLRLNEIDEKAQCESKKCGEHKYCDSISGECKKHLAPGSACSQDGQCENYNGRPYRCTWGRCIVNTKPGSAGTFCKDESTCQSDDKSTEMCCQSQPDISHFSKVCIPKLNEGATCGRASIFDVFRDSENEKCGICKTGLECRRIGLFTGRKICVRNSVAKSFDDVRKKSNIEKKHNKDRMDSMDQMDEMTSMDQMDK